MAQRVFEPEIELEHDERGQLAQTTATPGWKQVHRVMRSAVDRFLVDLINAEPENEAEVLANHKVSKAAAMFYQLVTNTINHEVQLYISAAGASTKTVDPTEHLLDLGELREQFAGLDHASYLEEGSLDNEY